MSEGYSLDQGISGESEEDIAGDEIGDDNHVSPLGPGAAVPTRIEYASYLALVKSLETAQSSNLAHHLAGISELGRSTSRSLSRGLGTASREEEEEEEEEDEEEQVTEADQGDKEADEEGPIDGTAVGAHDGDSSILPGQQSSKKRKRSAKPLDERYSTRWPLLVKDLPKTDTDLEEAIKNFASSHIRTHNLHFQYRAKRKPMQSVPLSSTMMLSTLPIIDSTNPNHDALVSGTLELEVGQGERERARGRQQEQRQDDDDDEFVDPKLPLNLFESTRTFINEILVQMAASRPKVTQVMRKKLRPVDWRGVIDAASLNLSNESVVRMSNTRLKEIYHTSKSDLVDHRLSLVQQSRESALQHSNLSLEELYKPLIPPKKDRDNRSHLSDAERAQRAERRRERERRKVVKEVVGSYDGE